MSYTPTTWATGDTVTATKLNKIENGIANAGSALIVTSYYVNGVDTMDKTVQEIYDAMVSGTPVYYKCVYGAFGTDPMSHTSLVPITYIYTYNTTGVIRVVISTPITINDISSKTYLLAPAVNIFQATGVNQYPTYYTRVLATNNTVR